LKNDLPEYKCPLCQSPLESENYQKAIDDLKKKVSETYSEENKKALQEFEQKLQIANKTHQEETSALTQKLQQQEEAHKTQIADVKASLEERNQTIQKEKEESFKLQLAELKKFYEQQNKDTQANFKVLEEQVKAQCKKDLVEKDRQLAELKKTYDKLGKDNQKNFAALEKKLRAESKKALLEKEKELANLRKEQARIEKIAFEKGKTNADLDMKKLENDIKERDLQIERFKRDADDLKKQLQQSQSELKGEIGEIDLYSNLTQAFSQDFFTRQKRGTSMGDVVQKIRTTSASLETPIVYDNKQAESVTAKDIEKAKKYKEIHGTEYVIIVSSNLPKKDVKNGLFGEKDGILLCHPCIVVDVARQIRRAIIEIGKLSESKVDRDRKETRLYNYIRSSEFTSTVEKLHNIYQKSADIQDNEERAHAKLWKERKALQTQITDVYNGICSGVDCIIQEKLPMQDLLDSEEKNLTEDSKIQEPVIIKKKRRKQEDTEQMV